MPVVPGTFELVMIQASTEQVTPWHRRFAELFETLFSTGFLTDYIGRPEKAGVRYVPVGQVIEALPSALPSDRLEAHLEKYDDFSIGVCQCRLTKKITGDGCGRMLETCAILRRYVPGAGPGGQSPTGKQAGRPRGEEGGRARGAGNLDTQPRSGLAVRRVVLLLRMLLRGATFDLRVQHSGIHVTPALRPGDSRYVQRLRPVLQGLSHGSPGTGRRRRREAPGLQEGTLHRVRPLRRGMRKRIDKSWWKRPVTGSPTGNAVSLLRRGLPSHLVNAARVWHDRKRH